MTYRTQEMLFSIVLLLIGWGLMYHTFDPKYANMAQDISVGPMFFPRFLLSIWLLCATGIFVQSFNAPKNVRPFVWRRVLSALGILCLFTVFFQMLGFIITGVGCFFGLGLVLGFRRILLLLSMSVVYVFMVDLVFKYVLQIYLPTLSLTGA